MTSAWWLHYDSSCKQFEVAQNNRLYYVSYRVCSTLITLLPETVRFKVCGHFDGLQLKQLQIVNRALHWLSITTRFLPKPHPHARGLPLEDHYRMKTALKSHDSLGRSDWSVHSNSSILCKYMTRIQCRHMLIERFTGFQLLLGSCPNLILMQGDYHLKITTA